MTPTPFRQDVFEIINGLGWTLGSCLIAIFIYYLIANARIILESYDRARAGRAWLHAFRVRDQSAVAFLIFIVGEVLVRGWSWLVRWLDGHGFSIVWLTKTPFDLVPILGAALFVFGMLCMIRVFQPEVWGPRAWMYCGGLSFGVVFILTLF